MHRLSWVLTRVAYVNIMIGDVPPGRLRTAEIVFAATRTSDELRYLADRMLAAQPRRRSYPWSEA